MQKLITVLGLIGASSLIGATAARAGDSTADFYKAHRLTMVVGMAAGDQYDNDARLLARYLTKHLPGNPTVVVQNMPGAGSLKAANYLATVAPKDGSMIGSVQRGVAMMPLLGFPEVEFKGSDMTWIGSRSGEISLAVVWHTAPAKTIQDVMKHEIIVGSTGGGADSNVLAHIYNKTIGTKFKVISGYTGGAPMNLAMERGETQGRVGWSIGALRGTKEDWYQSKTVRILLQHGLKKYRELPDVPLAQDLAKDAQSRDLLELFAKSQQIGFPVLAPPQIPDDRRKVLRETYMSVMHDKDYVADAKSMQMEVNPVSGKELSSLIDSIYHTPSSVVNQARQILISQGIKLK